MNLEYGQGISMKTIATYECAEHDITIDSSSMDVTGDISFVCGMLAHILSSRIESQHVSPLGKARYYRHKVLSFAHITNTGNEGH